MGIGPAVAIPAACDAVGITPQDVDLYERSLCKPGSMLRGLTSIGRKPVIALGHPLGMTGARQVATLLAELHRTKKKVGCVSMCIGTGMGMAAIIEAEGDAF